MSSIPEWQQLQEAQYFNWKCLVCNVLAKSPCHLEEQFLEHGVYVDIALSGLSAINAIILTTLPALKILLPVVNITVPFLSVNVPKFLSIVSLSSYDFLFLGSRMANDKDRDKKTGRGRSHKMSKVRARNDDVDHHTVVAT